jgi:glutamate formiminotransferase/formiminotetrahydrofolate cyclodeaminase
MGQQLVECVPNFSEGRRTEVIEAIERAIAAVNGVQLLDRHVDPDHNRSVITFVAPPAAAVEAAFAGIAKAAELIDLETHRGEHPRIGATDVVPFIPVREMSMPECVELARSLGKRVADALGIPVYLYEEAAARPDRVNLEDIRRGEYEGLKGAIVSDPNRTPDFGPARLGPAGATVIGARRPLIAYNVYLTTDEVEVAKRIAKTIRHSGGGLRFVKALGLLVEGRAQVSMNLTDFTRTPIHQVVEMIRREAARYGVGIHHSELVGLLPQQALIDAAQWYLQLDQFEPAQVLENRLFDSAAGSSDGFLDRLAAGTPTPGGGSAAAQAGAMAAALVAMVGRLTVGKKKYAEVQAEAERIIESAEALRRRLEAAVEHDARAYESVLAATRLPADSEQRTLARLSAIEQATVRAGEVPLGVARDCAGALGLALAIASIGNVNAISDAGVAGELALAGLKGAALNVRINAAGLTNAELAERWKAELPTLQQGAEASLQRLRAALAERAGL